MLSEERRGRGRHHTDKKWLIGSVKLAETWMSRFQNKYKINLGFIHLYVNDIGHRV